MLWDVSTSYLAQKIGHSQKIVGAEPAAVMSGSPRAMAWSVSIAKYALAQG
jgi:hypothetical protein